MLFKSTFPVYFGVETLWGWICGLSCPVLSSTPRIRTKNVCIFVSIETRTCPLMSCCMDVKKNNVNCLGLCVYVVSYAVKREHFSTATHSLILWKISKNKKFVWIFHLRQENNMKRRLKIENTQKRNPNRNARWQWHLLFLAQNPQMAAAMTTINVQLSSSCVQNQLKCLGVFFYSSWKNNKNLAIFKSKYGIKGKNYIYFCWH